MKGKERRTKQGSAAQSRAEQSQELDNSKRTRQSLPSSPRTIWGLHPKRARLGKTHPYSVDADLAIDLAPTPALEKRQVPSHSRNACKAYHRSYGGRGNGLVPFLCLNEQDVGDVNDRLEKRRAVQAKPLALLLVAAQALPLCLFLDPVDDSVFERAKDDASRRGYSSTQELHSKVSLPPRQECCSRGPAFSLLLLLLLLRRGNVADPASADVAEER